MNLRTGFIILFCLMLLITGSISCDPATVQSIGTQTQGWSATETIEFQQDVMLPAASVTSAGAFQEQVVPLDNRQPSPEGFPLQEGPTNVASILKDIIVGVNLQRTSEGLPPLVMQESLNIIAQVRSKDMVGRDYFSHNDPEDNSIPARDLLTGVGCGGKLAENIFATLGPLESVGDKSLEAWFNSSSHRANLMDPTFRITGIGLDGEGEWWKITQVFAERCL